MTHCFLFKRNRKKSSKEIRNDLLIHRENLIMGAYKPAGIASIIITMDRLHDELLQQDWDVLWKQYNKTLSPETLEVLTIFNHFFNNHINPENELSKLSDNIKNGEHRDAIHDLFAYCHFLHEKNQFENTVETYLKELRDRAWRIRFNDKIYDTVTMKPDIRSELLPIFITIADMITKGEYVASTTKKQENINIKQYYVAEQAALSKIQFNPINAESVPEFKFQPA